MIIDPLIPRLTIAVFFGFGWMIVYPDRALDWMSVSERMGKTYSTRHLVYLECSSAAGLYLTTLLAMSMTSRVFWWEPFVAVGFVGVFRCLHWLVAEILGLNGR